MTALHRLGAYVAVTLLGLGLWVALVVLDLVPRLLLPAPGDVVTAMGHILADRSGLSDAVVTTGGEVLGSFAIAVLAGVPLGLAIGRVTVLRRAYEPLLGNVSAIPLILFYPLFVGLAGVGSASKIVLGALYAFFPITIASIRATQAVDPVLEVAATTLGARRWRLFRTVVLPSVVPGVGAGLRVGLGLATVTVVAAEFITSTSGIGYQLAQTSQELQTPALFAWIVVTVTFTLCLGTGITLFNFAMERRLRR